MEERRLNHEIHDSWRREGLTTKSMIHGGEKIEPRNTRNTRKKLKTRLSYGPDRDSVCTCHAARLWVDLIDRAEFLIRFVDFVDFVVKSGCLQRGRARGANRRISSARSGGSNPRRVWNSARAASRSPRRSSVRTRSLRV